MVQKRVPRFFISVWLVLAFLFVACATTSDGGKAVYRAGTVTATVPGIHGDIKVAVTFSASKILAVKVVESSETQGLGDEALTALAEAIVEKQSLEVDAVSGATVSSNALLEAVGDCVAQARLP